MNPLLLALRVSSPLPCHPGGFLWHPPATVMVAMIDPTNVFAMDDVNV